MTNLGLDAKKLLFCIYANSITETVSLHSYSVFNNRETFQSAWQELQSLHLIDVIEWVCANVKTGAISCKITDEGKNTVDEYLKQWILKDMVDKEHYGWKQLKPNLSLEFHCSNNLPKHIITWGHDFIHELVRKDILRPPGTGYDLINTEFTINNETLMAETI